MTATTRTAETTGTTGTTRATRTFEKSIDNRKHLAERIAAISGQGIVYTRAPRYAYEIGVFSVERDGKLVVTINADNADNANAAAESVGRVIAVLKAEGSIGEEIITSTQASSSSEATETAEAAEPAETAEVAEVAEAINVADSAAVDETASELPNQPAMEKAEASTVIDSIMEAITDETAEQPQGASEEASEEADAEEPDTESINTPEISSIANMAEAATDNVINTAEIDSTDSTDSDTDSDNGMASDHCGENCLLGTEDWDDEADEEDSSDESQIEQAEQQMPIIQLQELTELLPTLPKLPADDSTELEDDSMIDYGQPVTQATQATEMAQTAESAILGAASELSDQQGMKATEVTEASMPTELAEDIRTVTNVRTVRTEQPQAATLETSEECRQMSETAPELTASTATEATVPTSMTSCADATASADNDDDFSFPLADHTPRSMLNLINMIYTRGYLLSKSTGGNFGVDKDLITILADDEEYESKEFLVDFIKEHVEEGARLDGISFTNTHVTFTGFPALTDKTDRGMTGITPEKLEVFKRLAARMNKMAKEQKRIVPKEIAEPNEKYAFRIWLIRLGMNGEGCKTDRKILLQNLSGHTAFRTEADKEKWIARQNAKKRKTHVAFERETTVAVTISN